MKGLSLKECLGLWIARFNFKSSMGCWFYPLVLQFWGFMMILRYVEWFVNENLPRMLDIQMLPLKKAMLMFRHFYQMNWWRFQPHQRQLTKLLKRWVFFFQSFFVSSPKSCWTVSILSIVFKRFEELSRSNMFIHVQHPSFPRQHPQNHRKKGVVHIKPKQRSWGKLSTSMSIMGICCFGCLMFLAEQLLNNPELLQNLVETGGDFFFSQVEGVEAQNRSIW